MRVATDDWAVAGEAVDCRDRGVSASALAAAIEAESLAVSGAVGGAGVEGAGVRVQCPSPGAVFERVGVVRPGVSVDVRGALVAAARSRSVTVPAQSALAEAREALAAVEVPEVDVAAARERVAAAREAEAAVHADVAAARGSVRAREELDADVESGRERLRAAVATASERETERVAAEQALARERERAREARDARSRRLELADRVGRLEREVREGLLDEIWGEFAAAVDAVPGCAGDGGVGSEAVGATAGEYAGDDVTAALAVNRVAEVSTPVLLAADRFDDAERAREVLDAPVVLASD